MIKVLTDYQAFSMQKYGGISRYFANIFYKAKISESVRVRLGLLYNSNYYIENEKFLLNNFLFRQFLKKESRAKKWNKAYCKYLLKENKFDIFHPTYYNAYFLNYLKKPLVITVHDMIYEVLPEYFNNNDPLTLQKKLLVQHANAIIAISESTKKDLMNILKVEPNKITVIHHGIDHTVPLEIKPVDGLPLNFLLYVGERTQYKNFFRFANCCAKLLNENDGLRIVFAGGGAIKHAELSKMESLGITDYCVQMNVTDAQLNYLYKKAKAFVFPSLYEGFGLPILEAFKAGCPIASSNTSCFPEIGGDAIAYFDPYDEQSMFNIISKLLVDDGKRANLVEKGYERLKMFSLDEQIEKTLAVYENVLDSPLIR